MNLRVLHVTNMFPSAARPAYGNFVAAQVHSLEGKGISQDVCILPSGPGPGRYIYGIAAVRRALAERSYDIVHAHYGLSGWVAMWQETPLVTTFAGSDLNGMPRGSRIQRLQGAVERSLSRWAARRSNHVIVMTSQMQQGLSGPDQDRKVTVLPYGIDTELFAPGSRAVARKKLGLPEEDFLVLWPHSHTPVKRRDLAEAALARVRDTLPRARLWKPPPTLPNDMPICYQAADCMPMLSEAEGSPKTVMEALSCCVPVIGVDVGDVWQRIGGIEWCRRVSREPDSIAEAMIEISGQPTPTHQPACTGDFDERTVAERLLVVYRNVIERAAV